MRARLVGQALAGLGGVVLAVAVLMPSPSPAPFVLPLDEEYDTVALGSDVTYLDPRTLEQRTGADVSMTVRVRGDAGADAADGDTAVRTYGTTTSVGDGTLLSTSDVVACLDRRSAEALDCPSESVDGRWTDVRGLTLDFPPGLPEPEDRMMWDSTAQASFPVRYEGRERLRGLDLERYEHVVPEQVLRSVTVAGALAGSFQETSSADVVYSATRVLLVEPVSGVVVSTREISLTRVRGADGAPGAVLLGGAFRSSEESVTASVARAREVLDREPGGLADRWPAMGAAVVLLGLGALLVARGRRGAPAGQATDVAVRQPVPVA